MSDLTTIAEALRARVRTESTCVMKRRLRHDLALAVFYRAPYYHLTISREHKPPSAGQAAQIKKAFGIPDLLSWYPIRQGRHHMWRISWRNGAAG
ncbi:MAG TPA: hypothetical protein VM537_29745 [Anaerolineae bacterium]|nr:hypothetical protein [Anaerolineae bacterium]